MKSVVAVVALLLFTAADVAAEQRFRFEYNEGEQYRILSTVDQNVFIDGMFSHRAEALNRISVTVEEVKDDAGFIDFRYSHSLKATMRSGVYRYGQEFASEFWRDERGRYTIEPEFLVPPTQNVPILPEDPVDERDTWTATGTEVFDLESILNVEGIVRAEMPVQYEYLGLREWKDGEYPAFSITYNVFHRPEQKSTDPWYPVRITGSTDQTYYWDPDRGRAKGYEESYVFVFNVANGQTIQFEGTASAEVLNAEPLDREKVQEDVERDLEDLGVDDASVSSDEEGVTITLDNIQFPPDSALLVESEREKLRRIATILRKYPERDILITGHTALAGTAEGRQQLSEERAAAVGNFLLEQGVRNRERLLYRGMGARDPVADNSTEEGMRKNRRVEITILEN
jgi:outer membrane protein OmpA-like peptidoglycan-associated protein